MTAHLQFLENALLSPNVQAFLKVIRHCEGTISADGYAYLFGSDIFPNRRITDFSKHPNKSYPFRNTKSDAAGAYQIMYPTYLDCVKATEISTFDPHSQDIFACERISYRNCLQKVIDGHLEVSILGCNKEWASLPLSPYGQPTHTMQQCIDWYKQEVGKIA